MDKWFDKAFGVGARVVEHGLGDICDRVIFEGAYGRNMPMTSFSEAFGWIPPSHPDRDSAHDPTGSRTPEQNRDAERGIAFDR